MQEFGEDNQQPPEWLGEIEPTFLSYEAVPLLNFPFFNEVSTKALLRRYCVDSKQAAIEAASALSGSKLKQPEHACLSSERTPRQPTGRLRAMHNVV